MPARLPLLVVAVWQIKAEQTRSTTQLNYYVQCVLPLDHLYSDHVDYLELRIELDLSTV